MNSLRSFFAVSKPLKCFFVVAFLLLAAGCSVKEPAEAAPEELTPELESALLERVTKRWHAMEAKDFASTYQYTTPNYRSIFSKSMYLNKFSYAVDWELTGVEVLHYDAQAAVASVAVRVMSKPTKQTSAASIAMGALPVTLHETWLFVDGEWWHSTKVK